MHLHLGIDTDRNLLLASTQLVGIGELVEIYSPDETTPRQACGKILRKIKDPNCYIVHASYEEQVSSTPYTMGDKTVLRVVCRNRSGMLRRKFSKFEKLIMDLEKSKVFHEKKVVRAKTGSVRRKNRPN
jgi:hypothetical protein